VIGLEIRIGFYLQFLRIRVVVCKFRSRVRISVRSRISVKLRERG
jgi:hypothetical protein